MLLKSINGTNIILSWLLILTFWLVGVGFAFIEIVDVSGVWIDLVGYHIAVLLISIFFSFYTKRQKATSNTNFVPSFLVVLFLNVVPSDLVTWELGWSILVLSIVVQRLIGLYNSAHDYITVFEIGLLSGLAIVLYPPFLLLGLFYIIGLTLSTSFSWRDFFIPILGMATVLLFSYSFQYLFGLKCSVLSYFDVFSFPDFVKQFDLRQLLLLLLSFCQVVILMKLFGKVEKQNIKIRVHYWLWIWMAVFMMISIVLFQKPFEKVILIALLGVPTSIFAIEYFLIEQRKPYWKKNLFLGVILILCVLVRLF